MGYLQCSGYLKFHAGVDVDNRVSLLGVEYMSLALQNVEMNLRHELLEVTLDEGQAHWEAETGWYKVEKSGLKG